MLEHNSINENSCYKSYAPEVNQYEITIDLIGDLKDMLYNRLVRAGYVDALRDKADFQYFNVEKRRLRAIPRRIVKSEEFHSPPEYDKALSEFEDKVERGADLTPFMSEKIKVACYDDLLLNDWGIYHFHLSRRYRDDGFVGRSEYQIFSYVTDDCMYLIQVFPHNTPYLYCKKEIVQILERNWPELIEQYHLKEVTELVENVDDRDRELIRKANVTSLVELGKGKVYGMIGGGYASNGFSCEALRNADFWNSRARSFQNCILDNADVLRRIMMNVSYGDKCFSGGCMCLRVSLCWFDNKDMITVCERKTGMVIRINQKEGFFSAYLPYEVFRFD